MRFDVQATDAIAPAFSERPAADYSTRWLLRAIARLGLVAIFLRMQLLLVVLVGTAADRATPTVTTHQR